VSTRGDDRAGRSVAKLLSLLKRSPGGAVFNPWWQVDADNDIGAQAPRIRREHLRAYLSERIGTAQLALVGEAVGYRGGHFSGIAMTSERMLLGDKTRDGIEPKLIFSSHPPRQTSDPQKYPRGFAEPTASIVWRSLLGLGMSADRFVLWNAFAWHSFDARKGMLSNRTPTPKEMASAMPVLREFLALFPCERVVALGRLSAAALTSLQAPVECVRHPASGGAALFRRQIDAIVRAL
jgi:hypothetical protein